MLTQTPRSPSSSGSFSLIAAAARRSTLKVPIRLTLTTLEKNSRLWGPPLWATRSAQPIAGAADRDPQAAAGAAARSTAAATALSSVTSASTKVAARPARRQRLALLGVEVGDRTRRPPASSARAVASPSPEAPPATCRTRPRVSAARRSSRRCHRRSRAASAPAAAEPSSASRAVALLVRTGPRTRHASGARVVSAPCASSAEATVSYASRCTVSGEKAGRQTATYSAPSASGDE